MKAIDLYSGIGGWSLGLKMAGIDVIQSFEYWSTAIETYNNNFNSRLEPIDLRSFDLDTLPFGEGEIDIIVGSPPCTQFSYANRGGKGDIQDGLVDIKIFLDFVKKLKPKFWIMENVPRVKKVLESHLYEKGGSLHKYRSLFIDAHIEVIDCSEFGMPQKRKRMIAGNYNFDQLNSYKKQFMTRSLGEVVAVFKKNEYIDPIYNKRSKDLTDHALEDCLDKETVRINKSMKVAHPIYNKMSFPDNLNKPSRTITATCTKVSRESIIVKQGKGYRRLTVRERASIQTFPIDFQFSGKSYSSKLKMIGNAIPPKLTYLLAQSMLGRGHKDFDLATDYKNLKLKPNAQAKSSEPEKSNGHYRKKRKFTYAIPRLRFGSGVRFQLNNHFKRNQTKWVVEYFFGSSKNIMEIKLDKPLFHECSKLLNIDKLNKVLDQQSWRGDIDFDNLQQVWIRKSKGYSPFKVLDQLGFFAGEIEKLIDNKKSTQIEKFVLSQHQSLINKQVKRKQFKLGEKYQSNYKKIFCGLLIGSWFNN
jgi:DNA (cytosine-5)-methyltransferase 1